MGVPESCFICPHAVRNWHIAKHRQRNTFLLSINPFFYSLFTKTLSQFYILQGLVERRLLMNLLEIVRKDTRSLSDGVGTGAFFWGGAIGWRPHAQQLGTDERAVTASELGSQLLDDLIVVELSFAVLGSRSAAVESGEDEHATGSAAGLVHPPDAAAERGSNTHSLFLRQPIEVGKGGTHRLGTVVSLTEIADSPRHTNIFIHGFFTTNFTNYTNSLTLGR
jgi:hypothetical protein